MAEETERTDAEDESEEVESISEDAEATPEDAREIEEVREIEEALKPIGVIKSATHGRIRLQLRPRYRDPAVMASLKKQLERDRRVKEVTINERTGSVIVTYAVEHKTQGHGMLWKAVKEAELVGEAAFELEPEEDEEEGEPEKKGAEGGTYGKLDQQLADLMYKIDGAIYRRTNGRIHTRGRVLPLGIAGLGVAQMVIYGISLEMLPGPLLIWLAHDIHVRFSKEPPLLLVPEPAATDEATAKTGSSTPADMPSASHGGMAPAAA